MRTYGDNGYLTITSAVLVSQVCTHVKIYQLYT